MNIELGRAARGLWQLREDGTFLNHGSYGACPRSVLAEQERLRREMESHPDAFMRRIHPDGPEDRPRQVAAAMAEILGAPAGRIALVENATTGVQAVLGSLPFAAGDQILITDHQYNAVRLSVEARCRQTGAESRVVRIPLPTTPDEVLQRIVAAAGPRVKLAVLDHITSSTALVFPIAELVEQLHARGVAVLVDGAHSLGQIPLAIDALGADWYVTNAHKWLYAPKGCALLCASTSAAPLTRPVLTSHYIDRGFPVSFDYVGTRDYTAWLSLPAALAFFHELGPARLREHMARVVSTGTQALRAAGASSVAPDTMSAAMRAFHLPQTRAATDADAADLIRDLWNEERIQIRATTLSGQLLLRFCAQAYVDEEDVIRLGEVLQRRGWPARR